MSNKFIHLFLSISTKLSFAKQYLNLLVNAKLQYSYSAVFCDVLAMGLLRILHILPRICITTYFTLPLILIKLPLQHRIQQPLFCIVYCEMGSGEWMRLFRVGKPDSNLEHWWRAGNLSSFVLFVPVYKCEGYFVHKFVYSHILFNMSKIMQERFICW